MAKFDVNTFYDIIRPSKTALYVDEPNIRVSLSFGGETAAMIRMLAARENVTPELMVRKMLRSYMREIL